VILDRLAALRAAKSGRRALRTVRQPLGSLDFNYLPDPGPKVVQAKFCRSAQPLNM
jgi:hypothetical protein